MGHQIGAGVRKSLTALASAGLLLGSSGSASAASNLSADRLMVVDCLLPGQVRKLGGTMTYLSPRRPVKSTTAECEIRGGEYVAYDRANGQTSLGVWMQGAEAGDAEAMTYVGVIYEKGLGMQPDYVKAAEWYQKAVDKGHTPAMSNLAYLYEQGLGVPKDETKALNLYRNAAGIKGNDLVFQSAVDEAVRDAQGSIDALTAQLETQNAQVDGLRKELSESQRKLGARRNELNASRNEAELLRTQVDELKSQSTGDSASRAAELRKLESDLAAREARVQQQLADIATIERSNGDRQARLTEQMQASSSRESTLRQAMGQSTTDAVAARTQLAATQARAAEMERQIAQLTAQLQVERRNLVAERARIERKSTSDGQASAPELSRLRTELLLREQALAQASAAIASLRSEKDSLGRQVSELRVQQAKIDKERLTTSLQGAAAAEIARAQIASLELRLLQSQQRAAEAQASLERERQDLAFQRQQLIQRRAATSDSQQREVQRLTQELASREARAIQQNAEIAALEAETKSYSSELSRVRQQGGPPAAVRVTMRSTSDGAADRPAGKARKIPAGLDLGEFHALVIGNDRYAFLPALETATNDARGVARVLETRYGFKTRVLTDATFDEILNAISDYRLKLREKDSLLIYYAGHGEIDRTNLRGYWLPVDARRDSSNRWITDQMITDQINLMAARHVLVVADSCYSGVMTRSAGVRLVANGGESAEAKRLLTLSKLPSRTVLTSGGEKPVLDGGGGGNSIFALAFIDALKRNEGVLEGSELYNQIFDPVRRAAARFKIEQSPRYAVLADTKHRNGEFLFIPGA